MKMSVTNVTADEFREYLIEFHRVLLECARAYLPPTQQRQLLHTAALPCRVVGYVSTQFGVAIDYDPPEQRTGDEQTTVEIVVGSKRIEDLVLYKAGAPKRMLRAPPAFSGIDHHWFAGIAFGGRVEMCDEQSAAVFDRCLFYWPPHADPANPNGREWYLGTAYLEMIGDRRKTR